MSNGVIRSRVVFDGDTMHHEKTQPTEDLILARNAEMRKDNVLGDLSFGRQVASIPLIMWEEAIRDGYDLACKDGEVAGREIARFLRSEKGKLCLVRDKV
jgi:hypothetical protein